MLVNGTAGQCGSAGRIYADFVAELPQQFLQLIATAVDIADQVEWAMLVPLIVVKRNALQCYRFDFFR